MQDEKAWFCHNIHTYQRSMYTLAYSILQNNEDAKDAVQDCIWKAYDHLDTLKNKAKFKPWVMKILANTAYDIYRRRRDMLCLNDQWDIPSPNESVDINTKLSLWDAVQSLRMPYREVVVLFYYEDFSIKEISKMMDSAPNAVKQQLSRARRQLKAKLGGQLDKEV